MRRETLPRRWARRCVTIPGVCLAFLAATQALPVLLLVALLVDLARRRFDWPTVRLTLFLWCALFTEVFGLTLLGLLFAVTLFRPAARAEHTWAVQRLYTSLHWTFLRSIFRLRVETEGAELAARAPVLLLVRHASLVDVLVPGVLVAGPHLIRLRYALKRELLWEPCLDVAGHWLPNHFVARGGQDTDMDIEGVRQLKDGLGAKDGVILFPEGTRFSAARRARAIEKLPAGSAERAAAEGLKSLLPLRLGGVLALLAAPPPCDVLFVGHAGLEGLTQLGDIWRGQLTGRTLEVKFWREPAHSIPAGAEAQWAWLQQCWERMDQWLSRSR